MVSKTDVPNYGVRRTHSLGVETYSLPGGTIVTRESRTFLFARDQRHTIGAFRGTVLRGTGRYAHAQGTISGGGPGVDNTANWTVTIHIR